MLTNHTNLIQSATQTLLTIGTRSLALVVDVNMAQAYDPCCHKRSHLHFGPFPFAGMPFSFKGFEPIRIHCCKRIPGSQLGEGWPASGRSRRSSLWSLFQLSSRLRGCVRRVVSERRVVQPGPLTGNPVAIVFTSVLDTMATVIDRTPFMAQAAFTRPALMGG
ncbi:hypothetical protein [Tautonia rosea]|uniref:hypothetical protein n=1 Tax=Tautonia rosea TaxID=2728037 RepID=UPI0014739056|nr:hypothetical protein [Tautonia rosea]